MAKIAVILDTQIAHNPEKECSFDELHIFEYDNTVNFIERHDLTESIEVFLPEVVLEEIIEHRIKNLHSSLSKLNNLRKLFASTNICEISPEDKSFNHVEYINKIKDRKLKEIVNIIPIPNDRLSLFNNILEKSLKKHPPFKQGKSDQGFKDSIILSSVIEYFSGRNEYDEIYLFSEDNGFSSLDINKIYEEKKIKLFIIKDLGIQDFIISKFKLRLELEEFIKEESFVDNIQREINENVVDSDDFKLKFIEAGLDVLKFTIERYTINEINNNECEVVCFGFFDIKKSNEEIIKVTYNMTILFTKKDTGGWESKIIHQNEYL